MSGATSKRVIAAGGAGDVVMSQWRYATNAVSPSEANAALCWATYESFHETFAPSVLPQFRTLSVDSAPSSTAPLASTPPYMCWNGYVIAFAVSEAQHVRWARGSTTVPLSRLHVAVGPAQERTAVLEVCESSVSRR